MKMASFSSQAFSRGKELVREGDGEEDDGEELLDPRVKGELDRLNTSTAEINRLEQDLEELQAAFRQTLTESAYVLNSQAAFLGKCVSHARPYYDAMRKAKQAQIETQKAALKYERTCTSHQAAKKTLAIAEQKLVSTSKEHKVLDPTWQEMLNQAILKVIESDKERALSEKEHLDTARTFSEAGNKVTELRTKLKSAISKSRPYFDLKMKYDQILEGHKRQVEITQESLLEAKKKYSLALKNLEGISEEIHEMRRSRDSLDTILHEREEGVGAESPCCDPSHDTVRPQTVDCVGSILNKPTYGFKIALVSASKNVQEASNVMIGLPVGERDGDPEGCNFFDEQQLDVVSKTEKLFEGKDSESRDGAMENQTCAVEIENRTEAGLNSVYQSEAHAVHTGSCEKQDLRSTDDEEEVMKVPAGKADEMCHTDKHLAGDDDLCRATSCGPCSVHETAIDQTIAEGAPLTNVQEQKSIPGSEDISYANQHLIDSEVSSSTDEASKSVHPPGDTVTQESQTGNASVSDSEEQNEKVTEQDSSQELSSNDKVTQPDHIGQTVSEESLTTSQEEKSQIESEKEHNRDLFAREELNSTDAASDPGHINQTVTQESVKEGALVTHSRVKRNHTGAENEIDNKPDSAAGEELGIEIDKDGHPDFQDETANQQVVMTENASEQKRKTEAENENAVDQNVVDKQELLSVAENDSNTDRIDEIGIPKTLPESESYSNSQELQISASGESNENAANYLIGQG